MTKKIALLSHRGGNIGHDFMAIGMEAIVSKVFGPDTEISHFEQHKHFSIYPQYHFLRFFDLFRHGKIKRFRRILNQEHFCNYFWPHCHRLKNFDLAIACGGPNIVRGVSTSAEMQLMFHHMYGAFNFNGVPVFDLGIGSCFPEEKLPTSSDDAFSVGDIKTFERLFANTNVTTVRDTLASKLMQGIGRQCELIACPAFCSGIKLQNELKKSSAKTIGINFQALGGNEDWGQNVDEMLWLDTISKVVAHYEGEKKILFICHSHNELVLAKRYFPNFEILFPKTVWEYAKISTQISICLCSRLHCAIPLASLGVPSLLIGTDSRRTSIEQMDLPHLFVKTASFNDIIAILNSLFDKKEEYSEKLFDKRSTVLDQYKNLLLDSRNSL